MKLALFSQNLTEKHIEKLRTFFSKPLEEVSFLYIPTAGNYKPYKSKWMIEGEKRWQWVFPKFQELDLERAFRVDPNFDFEKFFSEYDFIYIPGGNIFVLSYWMDKTGSREIIKRLILENKIVYGGDSAGMVFAYDDIDAYKAGDDPKKAPEKIDKGLGLIEFAPLPHWHDPEFQSILEMMKDKFEMENIKYLTVTNDQAIFVTGEDLNLI